MKPVKTMKQFPICLALLLLPVLVLFAGASGCETLDSHDDHDSDHHRDHDSDDHDYDHSSDYDHDGGSSELRVYDYYARREVYYNRSTQEYTYWNNDKLERRRSLPDYIRESMGSERVTLRLRGDEPEHYHEQIKREYPSRVDWDHQDHDRSEDYQHEGYDIPRGAHVYGNRRDAEAYDYYPGRGVFYNLKRGEYTFEDNGKWQRDRDPPYYIHEAQGSRRERIYVTGDRPEKYSEQVRRDYPR